MISILWRTLYPTRDAPSFPGRGLSRAPMSSPSAPVVTWRCCVQFHDPSSSSNRKVEWLESYQDISREVLWPAANGNMPRIRGLSKARLSLQRTSLPHPPLSASPFWYAFTCFLCTIVHLFSVFSWYFLHLLLLAKIMIKYVVPPESDFPLS
jgi:hypothetical protein